MHFTHTNYVLSLHIEVFTLNHDLVKVRNTHARDIISHCKHITHYKSKSVSNYKYTSWQILFSPPLKMN